jgi:CBS domain-containing protein
MRASTARAFGYDALRARPIPPSLVRALQVVLDARCHEVSRKEGIMKVSDIMTANLASCSPDTAAPEIARMMCDHDCGAIPVLDEHKRPVGVVTDRDIACRAVASGRDLTAVDAHDIMSRPVITISSDASLGECRDLMERHQIRRVLVVDASGTCCGIVAQADIAQHASRKQAGEVVRVVSRSHSQRGATVVI